MVRYIWGSRYYLHMSYKGETYTKRGLMSKQERIETFTTRNQPKMWLHYFRKNKLHFRQDRHYKSKGPYVSADNVRKYISNINVLVKNFIEKIPVKQQQQQQQQRKWRNSCFKFRKKMLQNVSQNWQVTCRTRLLTITL